MGIFVLKEKKKAREIYPLPLPGFETLAGVRRFEDSYTLRHQNPRLGQQVKGNLGMLRFRNFIDG